MSDHMSDHMSSQVSEHMSSHMENENENVNRDLNYKRSAVQNSRGKDHCQSLFNQLFAQPLWKQDFERTFPQVADFYPAFAECYNHFIDTMTEAPLWAWKQKLNSWLIVDRNRKKQTDDSRQTNATLEHSKGIIADFARRKGGNPLPEL